MGTITVPLSLGNVGIIETDGGSFLHFSTVLARRERSRVGILGGKNEENGRICEGISGHIRPSDN